ncbi:MAG: DUF1667 domain-containing protein [Turicibacter sp.]|nr:DUF1667 domain-containing protein [Turicibacter sp.]
MTKLICIVCPKGCHLQVDVGDTIVVTGHACNRGVEYGKNELKNPVRVITSTVRIENAIYRRIPVKTASPIPKPLIRKAMLLLDKISLAAPVEVGQIVVEDICGTGIPFVASRSMERVEKAEG